MTYYVRDAQGNTMAVYKRHVVGAEDSLTWKEQYIYGSSRLGQVNPNVFLGGNPDSLSSFNHLSELNIGWKRYELTNHLGNVLALISDRKKPRAFNVGDISAEYYEPIILSATDYYPFGMDMPGRGLLSNAYRYAFNGKEKDDSGEWGESTIAYDYGFQIYNPAIGKFLSVDPLMKSYPMLTPYQFASNRPIDGIDLDGLEYTWFVPHIIDDHGNCYYQLVKQDDVRVMMQEGLMGPFEVNLSDYGLEATFVLHNEKWVIVPNEYLNKSLNLITEEQWATFTSVHDVNDRVNSIEKIGKKAETAVAIASLADGISNILKGGLNLKTLFSFSRKERQVIYQADHILKSKGLKELEDAYVKGIYKEVSIDGRTIAFDPEIPSGKGYFAITNGKNGFNLGADAFMNKEELTKTVLHELNRLNFSNVVKTGSASSSSAKSSTKAADNFANKASSLLLSN